MFLSLKWILTMNIIIKGFNSIKIFELDRMTIDKYLSLNKIYTQAIKQVGYGKNNVYRKIGNSIKHKDKSRLDMGSTSVDVYALMFNNSIANLELTPNFTIKHFFC